MVTGKFGITLCDRALVDFPGREYLHLAEGLAISIASHNLQTLPASKRPRDRTTDNTSIESRFEQHGEILPCIDFDLRLSGLDQLSESMRHPNNTLKHARHL